MLYNEPLKIHALCNDKIALESVSYVFIITSWLLINHMLYSTVRNRVHVGCGTSSWWMSCCCLFLSVAVTWVVCRTALLETLFKYIRHVVINLIVTLIIIIITIKVGFHYLSWRPEFTGRVDSPARVHGRPVSTTRVDGCQKMHPSSRAVNLARELGPWTRVVETDLKYCTLNCQTIWMQTFLYVVNVDHLPLPADCSHIRTSIIEHFHSKHTWLLTSCLYFRCLYYRGVIIIIIIIIIHANCVGRRG